MDDSTRDHVDKWVRCAMVRHLKNASLLPTVTIMGLCIGAVFSLSVIGIPIAIAFLIDTILKHRRERAELLHAVAYGRPFFALPVSHGGWMLSAGRGAPSHVVGSEQLGLDVTDPSIHASVMALFAEGLPDDKYVAGRRRQIHPSLCQGYDFGAFDVELSVPDLIAPPDVFYMIPCIRAEGTEGVAFTLQIPRRVLIAALTAAGDELAGFLQDPESLININRRIIATASEVDVQIDLKATDRRSFLGRRKD